jgi:hypothetical protein
MSISELPDLISSLVEAVNQGDTKYFLDFFPSDAVVNYSGRHFVGDSAIL